MLNFIINLAAPPGGFSELLAWTWAWTWGGGGGGVMIFYFKLGFSFLPRAF